MIRVFCATVILAAAAGCTPGGSQPAARTSTPAPAPPTSAPQVPAARGKAKPPAPPKLVKPS
jgi:hypothetical protein